MTQVILFHHVRGLTEGVRSFADKLVAAGHDVVTPDLFEGEVFSTLDEGIAHVDHVGMAGILDAGEAAAGRHSSETVYAGFSLGALIAHKLAQTRPGALGALLYHHGDVPMTTFGETWPVGVDLQVHVNEADEFVEREVVEEFVRAAGATANAEAFFYPGSAHLFVDSSLQEYEPESAGLVLRRTLEFLAREKEG